MLDVAKLAFLASAAKGEALIEAMRAEKARVRPKEYRLCATLARFILGMRDELSGKAAAAQIPPDIDAVQLGRLRSGKVHADASSDAPRAILDHPESCASLAGRGSRPQEVGKVLMGIDETARIFRKAQCDQAEELLRIL